MQHSNRMLISGFALAVAMAAAATGAHAQRSHGGPPGARGGHHGHAWQGGHGAYGGYGGRTWSHGGRSWGPALFLGGIGLGLGLGYGRYYSAPWAPSYVVVEQPAIVYAPAPIDAGAAPAAPMAAPQTTPSTTPVVEPEPVIYPRMGQTPDVTRTDLQACKGWAAEQQFGRADTSITRRAIWACMDGRGYTLR